MTVDSREESQHQGEPVECFRFASGGSAWTHTSADREVTIPAGTFAPDFVMRSEIEHSQEDTGGTASVTVAQEHPVAALFVDYAPESPVSLTMWRAHRGEEDLAVPFWSGLLASATFEGSETTLHGMPDDVVLGRRVPGRSFQATCPWALYGPGCLVDRAAFTDLVVVSTVSGFTLTGGFGARPDRWYENGWAERLSGEKRMIVRHVGGTVTLKAAFRSIASGETVRAVAGCLRTESVCTSKFGNLVRFGGMSRIPVKNPHVGRLV